MQTATFADLLANSDYKPEPKGGVHTITIEKVSARGTRRYLQVVTEAGGRCEVTMGDERKQKRILLLLLGHEPEDIKAALAGQKFRVRLAKRDYKGTEYWEISRA